MAGVSGDTLRRFIQSVRFQSLLCIALFYQNDTNFSLDSVSETLKKLLLSHCAQVLQEDSKNDLLDSLRCVRILTRDDQCLDQLSTDDFLKPLFTCAFVSYGSAEDVHTIESLKALSNLVFKRPVVLKTLRSFGIVERLLERLKAHISSRSRGDVLLLDLKLFFLLSGLESSIRRELAENSDAFCLFELLKVVYNVAYAIQRDIPEAKLQAPQYDRYCVLIRELLTGLTISNDDQRQLIGQLVNFLNIVPRRSFVHLLSLLDQPPSSERTSNDINEQMPAIQALIDYLSFQLNSLDESGAATSPMQQTSTTRLDEALCPVLNALIRGSQANRSIRKYCRSKILPHLGNDARRLPEEGSTLRNRLCKLLTNPQHGVSELVALLLFVLCKEDISRAIKYTGFGNFAGFLARHALLAGASKKRTRKREIVGDTTTNSTSNEEFDSSSAEEYSSNSSASDTEEYERLKNNINPVTGRWEADRPHPLEGMSEEQKEYVTMELVNKIDQLQRSGLIKPGTVGEDGRVRPVEHVLELLEQTHGQKTQDDSE
ncbi:unnamed protein product [Dicrocoelium dendriticum]|nr:unnamed protein product [Dicrocoelium dendriticum]